MKQRLSRRRTVFEKLFLTIFLFFILSLPTPFGLFNYLLIPSDYGVLGITQRVVHFILLFTLINRVLQDNLYLEFDRENLYLCEKRAYTEVPLEHVHSLQLLPKYFEFNKNSRRYSLSYLDESGITAEVTFYIFPGRKLKTFIELVKEKNKDFEHGNFAWFA